MRAGFLGIVVAKRAAGTDVVLTCAINSPDVLRVGFRHLLFKSLQSLDLRGVKICRPLTHVNGIPAFPRDQAQARIV